MNGSSAGEQARDLTRLGDWARWMGRRSDSRSYYDKAWRRITPPPVVPEAPEAAASPEPAADAGAEPSATTEVAMNEAGSDNTPPDAGAVEAPVDVVAVAEGEEATVDEVSGAAEAGEDAPAVEEMVAETAPEAGNEDTSITALTLSLIHI